MLRGARLATALAKVKLITVHGPWSRILGFHHVNKSQPLWGGAAAIKGARFTPKGGFNSIYLAWELVTALLEVQALVIISGGIVSLRTPPWTLVTVDGIVSNVLDLTDGTILKALGTNEQEMTGAWAKAANIPTQELALAAYDSGKISGIKYGSAKHVVGVNLVVFADRLEPPSTDYLEVFDPHGNLAQRIGA